MNVLYGPHHATEWAHFSGDHNPIHFDTEKAKAAGMDGLSVHGMRALLDMKALLSRGIDDRQENSGSYRFIARLREAIKCYTPYQLRCENGQSQLNDTNTGRCCFSGKLEPIADASMEIAPLTHRLNPQELMSLRRECPGEHDMAEWCFLDAILFRQMVLAPEILASVKETFPQLKTRTLAELFSQVQVVQTHHEVLFSRDLLEGSATSFPKEDFNYGILPAFTMGDAENGLVVRLAMHGSYPGRSRITMAATLKLRSLIL